MGEGHECAILDICMYMHMYIHIYDLWVVYASCTLVVKNWLVLHVQIHIRD